MRQKLGIKDHCVMCILDTGKSQDRVCIEPNEVVGFAEVEQDWTRFSILSFCISKKSPKGIDEENLFLERLLEHLQG